MQVASCRRAEFRQTLRPRRNLALLLEARGIKIVGDERLFAGLRPSHLALRSFEEQLQGVREWAIHLLRLMVTASSAQQKYVYLMEAARINEDHGCFEDAVACYEKAAQTLPASPQPVHVALMKEPGSF